MKILYLGDMSSIFVNLSIGMIKLGHDVRHLSDGDGFKKTPQMEPKNLVFSKNKILRMLSKVLILCFPKMYLGSYDVVHIVNTNIFGLKLNIKLLKRIKKVTKILVLTSAGSNYFSWKFLNTLDYSAINELIEFNSKGDNVFIQNQYVNNDYNVAQIVDLIIPNTWTYSQSFIEFSDKMSKIVPFPLDLALLDGLSKEYMRKTKKISILYGVTRNDFKGSKYIIPALEMIQSKFRKIVNIVIVERLSLKEYLIELAKADIVVDQALSYEYGYNALYAMALGKVVLSGNYSSEFNEYMNSLFSEALDNPVVNISPNSEYIFKILEHLVKNPELIKEIGNKSYDYVKKVHDIDLVAKMYTNMYLTRINQL